MLVIQVGWLIERMFDLTFRGITSALSVTRVLNIKAICCLDPIDLFTPCNGILHGQCRRPSTHGGK